MYDKFEQELRKSLGDPPDYPFDERVWQDMEKKLGRKEPQVDRKRPFWLLPALAALVPLLLLVGLYSAYHQQAKQIATLEQLVQETALLSNSLQREVTVVYDTIYREYREDFQQTPSRRSPRASSSFIFTASAKTKGTYRQNAAGYPNNWAGSAYSQAGDSPYSSLLFPTRFSGNNLSGQYGDLENGASTGAPLRTGQQNQSENKVGRGESTEVLPSLAARPWPPLVHPVTDNLPEPILPPAQKKSRNRQHHLSQLKPSSLAIAGAAGIFRAEQLPAAAVQDNLTRTLGLEIGYGQSFRFLLGGAYLSSNFTLGENDFDPTIYPAVTPNDPDDELEGLRVDSRFWQLPLGAEFVFLPRRRLRPVLGLGLVGVKPQQSLLSYEFEDDNDNYYTINRDNPLTRDFVFSDAWLMLGMEYNLARHWGILIQAQRQWSYQPGNYAFADREYRQLTLGIRYQFWKSPN